MAYYNANRIIKLTRIAIGMTQERLCDGICSVTTLSRIEKGGGLKRDTYRQLMERMERVTEEYYVVCVGNIGGFLEKQAEMEKAFQCQDYEKAEQYLYQMKKAADYNILTKQYLMRAEAVVKYYQKQIGGKELLHRVSDALRLTVPKYEKYLNRDKIFPFIKEELMLLMSMGIAYNSMSEREKSLQMYGTVLRCLAADYMGKPDNEIIRITVNYNISKMCEAQKKNIEALEKINECLKMSVVIDHGHMFAKLLLSKASNLIELAQKEENVTIKKIGLKNAEQCLQQAYYIAVARKDNFFARKVKEYYIENFRSIT
ncbi:MAG: hypothetical protein HFH82_08045 [Lachnospiraceae bacterium]|nr:hypothetical protein [Lachnospiraceae bacterium]